MSQVLPLTMTPFHDQEHLESYAYIIYKVPHSLEFWQRIYFDKLAIFELPPNYNPSNYGSEMHSLMTQSYIRRP